MPIGTSAGKLDAGDRRLLGAAAAILFLIVLVAAWFAPPQSSQDAFASSYAASSGGALGAYELLAEGGYPVRRWTQAPRALPAGAPGSVLILADPLEFVLADASDRAALLRFVRAGGRVVTTGPLAGLLFPALAIRPAAAPDPAAAPYAAEAVGTLTRSAPRIEMAPQVVWAPAAGVVPLYGDGNAAVAILVPLGQGEIVWWGSSSPLTNFGIQQSANLTFFLNAVEGRRAKLILWDEYFHGETAAGAVAETRWSWKYAAFPLAVLALALLLTFARRSGPLYEMEAVAARESPLEFATHIGGMYERARATRLALDLLRQAALRRGLAAGSPAAAATVLAAAARAIETPKLTPAEALPIARRLQQLGTIAMRGESSGAFLGSPKPPGAQAGLAAPPRSGPRQSMKDTHGNQTRIET